MSGLYLEDFEAYNDPALLYRDTLEQEIYEEKLIKERMRPPKQNNKKRKIARDEAAEIAQRRRVRRRNEKKGCKNCGAKNEFNVDTGGVCTECGFVTTDWLEPSFADNDRCRRVNAGNARRNYFNELLSQLCRDEPPIPFTDRERLLVTYNDGFGWEYTDDGVRYIPIRRRNDDEALLYDPRLHKEVVEKVVEHSGLSQKKYVEKWRTIRVLLGAEPNPKPNADVQRALRADFKRFEAKWQAHPELHPRRSSIPCYAWLMRQLMLRRSVELYDEFAEWLPIVTKEKLVPLQLQYAAFCRLLEWTAWFPAKNKDGKTIRVKLVALPDAYKKTMRNKRLMADNAKRKSEKEARRIARRQKREAKRERLIKHIREKNNIAPEDVPPPPIAKEIEHIQEMDISESESVDATQAVFCRPKLCVACAKTPTLMCRCAACKQILADEKERLKAAKR